MREVLFRGKRVDNGEWVYGLLFKEYSGFYKKYYWAIQHLNKFGIPIAIYEIVPETVGRYTGLADKNHKKIFEGDICDFNILVKDHTLVEISIKHGCVGFEPLDYDSVSEDDKKWNSFWKSDEEEMWNPKYFSVIGNIHDNPELLEVKV